MHHHIVVKVWAEDESAASSQVTSAIEESINPEQNSVGWDYSSDPVLITKDKLQSDYGVKTFKELEKSLITDRLNQMQELIGEIKYDLTPVLASLFLTKKEAPLYVNSDHDGLKDCIEKILKRKKDVKKPDTFNEFLEVFLKVLVSIAKKDTGHCMIMWRLEQIKKLQYCIESSLELCYTLQSSQNPFAEIPCESKKGLSSYYFLCDRHL